MRLQLGRNLRRSLLPAALLLACASITGAAAPTRAVQPRAYGPHVPGIVLLKLAEGTPPSDRANLRAQLQARRMRRFRSGAESWKLGGGVTTEQAIARLEHNPHVAYAEPDYLLQADLVPNDPSFPSLWGLDNKGQTGGTAGADIGAVAAWDITTGSRSVVVGVIDSGIDYNHPDLAANVYTNPGEIAGNGVDDDLNGFVDDVHGWDFINDDEDPFDDNGHGTHVSGTIGAVGDNGIGVVGVNWQVSIMPLKFLGSNGSGSTSDAVAAIDYATSMGVRILSNSWGGTGFSQTLLDAIDAAAAADILFVASAGNSGSDNDFFPHYPSSYDTPNIVSVANTNHDDVKAPSSNYGAISVDLAAPGTNILSTLPGGIYGSLSGTSMACPHVSGVAALTLANAPGLDALSLKQTLLDTAERVPALAGLTVTGGRVFAPAAVRGPDSTSPGPIADLAASDPTSNTVTLRWTATGDDEDMGTARSYDVRYSTSPIDAAGFGAAPRAANAPAPSPAGSPEAMEVAGLAAGTPYYFAVKAIDDWGNAGDISNVVTETTLPPPTFDSSPGSFTVSLLTGQETMLSLNLRNIGVGTLDWKIPPPVLLAGGNLTGLGPSSLSGLESSGALLAPPTTGTETGSGYLFTDSDRPGSPPFEWTDIAEAGTPISSLTGNDEVSERLELGFDFPLYGTFFDAVRVSTDGWLSFTSTRAAPGPGALPDAAAPANLVAPFWADLDFQGVPRASYVRGWDAFTVQYTGVPRRGGAGSYTFQATLREDGSITFAYLAMDGGTSDAAAGIQDASGARGIAIDSGVLHDAQAVQISPLSQWLTASPTSGRLFGGQDEDVALLVSARNLPGGSYTGIVDVETNDPARPVVPHTISLNVTDSAAIEVDAAAIEFGDVHVGFSAIVPILVTNTGTLDLDVTISSTAADVAPAPASFSVAPGAARNVDVTFTPSAPGPVSSAIEIASNASNAPAISVPVAGNGLASPAVAVSPMSLSAQLLTSQTSTRTLRVTNTGAGTLSLQATTELTAPGPVVNAAAVDPDAEAGADSIPVPEIRNGGFELGNFSGWSATTNGFAPLTPWTVHTAGGGYFGNSSPIEGNVDLYNGFDGDAGLEYTLTQQIDIPPGTATAELSYHDRIVYDSMGEPSTLPRVYLATIRDTSMNILGTIVREEILLDGQPYTDTGWRRRTFDLAPFAGKTVVLHIWERIPESFTGPAMIEFDDFRIAATAVPTWLMVSPPSASIPPGGSQDLSVTFDAGGSGTAVYHGSVRLETNDPAAPVLKVPAVLDVTGVPDILVHGPEITVSSTQAFTGAGASTTHALHLPSPPARDGAFDLIAEGDYGSDFETATIVAEGSVIGSVGGTGTDCSAAVDSFQVTRSMLAALAADGVVDVLVRNSADVQDICTDNRHTVKLRYRSGINAVAFGSVFVGGRATDTFAVSNDGADPLVVTSISGAEPDFTASPSAFVVPPGGSQIVTLEFAPASTGTSSGTLTIASNDPDTPAAPLSVSGMGLAPPILSVTPQALQSTLPSDGGESQTLTIANLGTNDLQFALTGTALPSANAACSATTAYLTSFNTGILWKIDLANQTAGAITAGLESPNEGLVVDHAEHTAYVTEAIVGTISAVDLVNGGISRVVTGLGFPVGLALDGVDSKLYVTEFNTGKLLAVDLSTFAVQPVASGMANPAGLALDPSGSKAYICDFSAGTIEVADLTDGSITRLASGLTQPYSVALDRPRGRLLVSEFGSGELSSVDLATGGVSLVAGNLPHPIGVAADLDSTTAYVGLFDSGALVAVDLATGGVNALVGGFSGPSGLHVPAPPGCLSQFLSLSVRSGTIAPSGSVPVGVTFDATGLLAGTYPAEIGVSSNDPLRPFVAVPVRLDVTGTPDLAIAGTKIEVESTIDYGTDGAVTNHALPVSLPPVGGATVELIALGDHGLPSETATATGEGIFTLTAGGAVVDCVPAVARLGLSAADVAALVSDGVVNVTVQNSPDVNPICPVNQHTVRLGFELRSDLLDFRTVFTGTSKDVFFDIENRGTDVLHVSSIASGHPEIAIQPSSFSVPPRSSRTVTVTFAPSTTGTLATTVEIDSDDPDTPHLGLPVAGIGADPPVLGVSPGSLASTLLSGDSETQQMTISNGGPSDLDVEISASLFGSSAETSPFAGLGSELPGYSDNPPPPPPAAAAAALQDPGGPEEEAAFADGLPGDFEPLASSPEPLTCVAEDQDAGIIYAQSNRTSTFYRYVADEDRWETLAHAPLVAVNNCGAALLNGKIYTAYTLDTTLGVYDIASDTWTTMPSPLPNGTGNIGSDGARWLYLVEGTHFMRVDPATGQKEALADPPFAFQRWGGLREINGVFFGHQGNGLAGFAAYDTATGIWRALASLPTGAVLGSAASAQEGEYYAYGNYGARNILAYSTTTATWSARTNPYFPINDGGLAWLPRPVPGVYIVEGQSGPRMARMITGRQFLGLHPVKATVPPGSSTDVDVTFDSAGLLAGPHPAEILISSNDPLRPLVSVAATLDVIGSPKLFLTGGEVSLESTMDFTTAGQETIHDLQLPAPPAGGGRIELEANGDYAGSGETAEVRAEGLLLGSVGASGTDCAPTFGSFPIDANGMAVLSADGTVEVSVKNSFGVDPFCVVNQHKVRLVYDRPADDIDYGIIFVGATAVRSVFAANTGTDPLHVQVSFAAPGGDFTASPMTLTVAPGEKRAIAVSFSPGSAGPLAATLLIDSDDPRNAHTEIGLAGTGRLAPVVGASPASLGPSTRQGSTTAEILTLSNTGGSDLNFTLVASAKGFPLFMTLSPSTGAVPAGSTLPVTVTFDPGALDPGLYFGLIVVQSDDPVTPALEIPVRFRVFGIPDIRVDAQEKVQLSSSAAFSSASGVTTHHLGPAPAPAGDVTFEMTGEGNFSGPLHTATVRAEGVLIGSIGPAAGSGCTTAKQTVTRSQSVIAPLLADGFLDMVVQNSPLVGASCPANSHALKVTYPSDRPGLLKFGALFVGAATTRTFEIRNLGNETLVISSITSSLPDYVAGPASLNVTAGGKQTVTITFVPRVAGSRDAVLTIASDDPDTPAAAIDLAGTGLPPPVAAVSPGSFEVAVPPGGAAMRALRVANDGQADLSWALDAASAPLPSWLSVAPLSGTLGPGESVDLAIRLDASGLADGDRASTLALLTNDPARPRVEVDILLHSGEVDLAWIDLDPDTLSLRSSGSTIRALLQLPAAYDPAAIVVPSIRLEGAVAANPFPVDFTDENGDGVGELMVKFDRAAVQAILSEGQEIPVRVTGEVRDTTWFTGTAVIRVIRPALTAPAGGEYLLVGQGLVVAWSAPAWPSPLAYAVELSRDAGATWTPLASGLKGTSFSWSVSGPIASRALLRVTAADAQGALGSDTLDRSFVISDGPHPPAGVGALRAAVDGGELVLTWERPEADAAHGPVADYGVLRASSAAGPFTEIARTPAESHREPLSASPARIVYYAVAPANATGEARD